MHLTGHRALFTTTKIWKQPKSPSVDARIKTIHNVIHTHTHTHTHTVGYYSAIKKNEFFPFATTWMDWEGIMLSEVSQTKKDKYCITSLICRI